MSMGVTLDRWGGGLVEMEMKIKIDERTSQINLTRKQMVKLKGLKK